MGENQLRNDSLRDLYNGMVPPFIRSLYDQHLAEGLSLPHLIQCWPAYEGSQVRLMIIGKQTNGWGPQPIPLDPVDAAIDLYMQFQNGRHEITAFWAVATLMNRLANGPCATNRGLVWANLLRFCQGNAVPRAEVTARQFQELPLLPAEIQILRPHAILFLTGPAYDRCIEQTFTGAHVTFQDINGFAQRQLAEVHVDTAGLPRMYRTYHPGHIARPQQDHLRKDLVAWWQELWGQPEAIL